MLLKKKKFTKNILTEFSEQNVVFVFILSVPKQLLHNIRL